MSLVSHLNTQDQPIALINALASRYFVKRHLAWANSDPANARTQATLGIVD